MNNTYKIFNDSLPYDCIVEEGDKKGFGRQIVKIFKKSDNKTIIEYERNYHSYGDTAWGQFKYKEKWYLIISKSYSDFCIIDPETLKVIATLDKEKTGCNFCPVNFYVPSFIPTEMEINGKKHYFGLKIDDDNITSEFNVINIEDLTLDQINSLKFNYIPKLLVAGVWWGADYDWEIYHLDLDEIFSTGIIEVKNKLNWEIPREDKPIIRNYFEISEIDLNEDNNIKYLLYRMLGINYINI